MFLMFDFKNALALCVVDRCQHWEKELETKEMKEQMKELISVLQESEIRRKDIEKELKMRDQTVAIALATSASVGFYMLCVVFDSNFFC